MNVKNFDVNHTFFIYVYSQLQYFQTENKRMSLFSFEYAIIRKTESWWFKIIKLMINYDFNLNLPDFSKFNTISDTCIGNYAECTTL